MTPPITTRQAIALWGRVAAALDSRDIAIILGAALGVLGTMLAATIAARAAVNAYKSQQAETRRQQRATFYAEAIRAVEDYTEAPYRILRRDGSHQARREITQHISDVKSRISFYSAWMTIHGTDTISTAYNKYVRTAETEAGRQMTAAWRTRPTRKDKDVALGSRLPRTATDAARADVLAAMKADLNR